MAVPCRKEATEGTVHDEFVGQQTRSRAFVEGGVKMVANTQCEDDTVVYL